MAQISEHLKIHIPCIGYQNDVVIQAQDIFIPKSRWTCILGHSGSGKTTFLSWLSGLLCVPNSPSPFDQHEVFFLSQKNQLLPWKKVLDQVFLGDLLRGATKDTSKAKFILNQVGMGEHTHKYPHELSQGMKQRVVLARAIYEERPYILLDEPFSSLDVKTKNDLYEFIHQYLNTQTIIHVTHDIVECLRLADEVFILKGTPALFHQIQPNLKKLEMNSKPRCANNASFWKSSMALAQELHF